MSLGRIIMGPQLSDSVQTTDATANVLLLECPIPDNTASIIGLTVEGIHSVDSVYYDSLHAVTRNGVAATYIGLLGAADRVDNGSAAWVITVDCSTTFLRVRVTGEAAHTINWRASADFKLCAESYL